MTKQQLLDRIVEVVDVTRRRLTTGPNMRALLSDMVNEMYPTAGEVMVAKLFIPSAEVLQLNTTPKAFGLNVPAGYFVQPLAMSFRMTDTGGVAYDTNVFLEARYIGGVSPFGSGQTWIRVLSSETTRGGNLPITSALGTGAENTQQIIGADIEIYVKDDNPQTGTGNLTLYLTYMLIEI